MQVLVRDNNVDQALKVLKKKMQPGAARAGGISTYDLHVFVCTRLERSDN